MNHKTSRNISKSVQLKKLKEKLHVHDKFPCSCGRSPTGKCCGWHRFTEEEYMIKFKQFKVDGKLK